EALYDRRKVSHRHLLESVIKVPLLIKFPDNKPTREDPLKTPLETIDVTATLADYTGVSRQNMDGESFLDELNKSNLRTIKSMAITEKAGRRKVREVRITNGNWIYTFNYESKEGRLEPAGQYDGTGKKPAKNQKNRLKKQFKQVLFQRLGRSGSLNRQPLTFKTFHRKQLNQLKALGYIE
ncbi:MAG: hypothetical protein ABEJ65_01470, partial [bacterium]